MFPAPKNKFGSWQPSASIETLRIRAKLLQGIRQFFETRNVLEVDTPLLCHTSVTDPFIQSISAHAGNKRYFLQTSPEYCMKRLLAAGSGPIFQICKAFRQEEIGQNHNPEFTMLEWYRPSYNHMDLMEEMDELLQYLLQCKPAEKISYSELFKTHLNLDPFTASIDDLQDCAHSHQVEIEGKIDELDTWLMILMSHLIEPSLGKEQPCFVFDFPATQAALAKISTSTPAVASRFEVYFKGIELANGFHELNDAAEQRHRFELNLTTRKNLGLDLLPLDELFLAALPALPDCAGVALGLDRLLMLLTTSNHIADVISFDFSRV